jgi:predicted TPR repeat methyltransferase
LVDEEWAFEQFAVNHALDLGCGTGLSGMAFRDSVKGNFVGIDLSPEMIAKARKRGCYDSLEIGDVASCLKRKDESYFDFVCACDVLVYLGDLREVMIEAQRVLRPGGLFAFSVELLENNVLFENYSLHACARFSHSSRYLLQLARETGFDVQRRKKCPLRKNQGKEVQGLLLIFRKKS